jgi:CheY-like chemotaxis protein
MIFGHRVFIPQIAKHHLPQKFSLFGLRRPFFPFGNFIHSMPQPFVGSLMPPTLGYLQGSGEYANRKQFPLSKMLVTDIKMPGGRGLELLAWIRDHPELRIIPTVVMSSSHRVEDVKAAYCLGANAYLCKPIDHEKLKEVFSALLRFWSYCEVPQPGNQSQNKNNSFNARTPKVFQWIFLKARNVRLKAVRTIRPVSLCRFVGSRRIVERSHQSSD